MEIELTETFLSPKAVAKFLGVNHTTLASWRFYKTGPKYLQLSEKVLRYRACDLLEWCKASIRDTGKKEEQTPEKPITE